jgi:hypothetical protein
LLAWSIDARAVLDIEDKGPVLNAGGFAMRVTNAGIIGNAFIDNGLSYDPSFEIHPGSGLEALSYAALWVGAVAPNGEIRVSGGPLLEWRPTLDPEDRVRSVNKGLPGARRNVDDDGDGRVDEEIFNGLDDDQDGEIDEDLGLFAQQTMTSEYVDDRPEALYYVYEGSENHRPLGLSVHQEAYAWSAPGYDGIAGLSFRITNHGRDVLKNVRIGLLADLDSRERNDRGGHLDDRVEFEGYRRGIRGASDSITVAGIDVCGFPAPCPPPAPCITTLAQTLPVITDFHRQGFPATTVIPLGHTTDPLALIPAAAQYARAPSTQSFRSAVFSRSRIPGQGGLPSIDRERYEAMAGAFPVATTTTPDDYVVLVSCGPFATLSPGQSLEFEVALVSTLERDSLSVLMGNAAVLHHGEIINAIADSLDSRFPRDWNFGVSGINGHEVCIEAPPGVTFVHDPHCPSKFPEDGRPGDLPQIYRHGQCIWTDADCQRCTGMLGFDTRLRWLDPGDLPLAPPVQLTPGDRAMRIEWSNLPEIYNRAGLSGPKGTRFAGYRVYKLADWRDRKSLLPPHDNWALLGAYGLDTRNSGASITTITDTTLDYERILYEQKLYPIGRYAVQDSQVLNGFDYAYAVTTVLERDIDIGMGLIRVERFESPFAPRFEEIVRPAAASRDRSGKVWVVPNPFRGSEVWQRPDVLGDPLSRHIDFMGLPRARATIKIWTVAGDHVATIDHDGSRGDGEAAWNLVSRNGQEIESGIYLFTVDSTLGRDIGRFVVIR